VLQLRILSNILKIFKIKKNEIHTVLNNLTALYIKKKKYSIYCTIYRDNASNIQF